MPTHVYYLDDERQLCDVFAEFIADDDIQVTTFTEADLAIDACKTEPPDIMFLDYRLADTTGIEVAETLETLDKDFVKILVTGELESPSTKLFHSIIPKPYRLVEIKSLIQSLKP